ncbi:3707_t:CDS:1 [Diversispora eburnea]|uniref:3707_t:CDS:1 n=1 Tax=Diversispora eburnea TaxID=1213867 RepID=A0A9N9CKH3_9GLOM|nr:3707_t:CDS:1 [Diversispora eburnea]
MIPKNKIFTFLAALFLICLVFSHAAPVPGDFATVTLAILDGKITFTQVEDGNVKVEGKINKGIEKNTPDDYFVQIAMPKVSFPQFGIKKIEVPGTARWKTVSPGEVNQLIGLDLLILHKDEVLDSGTIIIPP